MAKLNQNYKNLKESYLFSEMAKRTAAFSKANPDTKIIRMGIGDVTLPLPRVVVDAMKEAAEEQTSAEKFRGYGPEQGYSFLREALSGYYKSFGVTISPDDVFISDGAKSDVANITDIFDLDNVALIPNPVYPVYLDTNTMVGRTVKYLDCTAENNFLPGPPDFAADMIYLCSPNNPTGGTYTRSQLEEWVAYAKKHGSVILFDSAYEAFIEDPALPRSIFEIPGARECAIEFGSLSKTAGFTGTRCSYTVVPSELMVAGDSVHKYWLRRQTTKFNGVPYIIQRGAEAAFSEEGIRQCQENIRYYKENAKIIGRVLTDLGISYIGGVNSPYLWLRCPKGMGSWEFFDFLLNNCAVVATPGEGFGQQGEGYMRISSFGGRENVMEAMERIRKALSE